MLNNVYSCLSLQEKEPQTLEDLENILSEVWPLHDNGWSAPVWSEQRVQTSFYHPNYGCLYSINVENQKNVNDVIQNICDICQKKDVSELYQDMTYIPEEERQQWKNALKDAFEDLRYMLQESFKDINSHPDLCDSNRRMYGVRKDIMAFLDITEKENQKESERERE